MMSVIRSGLDAAMQNLDVTSNNIANARTTGYKKQQATFTDMYSTKIATATGDRLGIGVQMPEIRASQMQGNLQKTNTVMDLAIEGEGLFALRDVANPNVNVYTRDGSFTLNKEGNVLLIPTNAFKAQIDKMEKLSDFENIDYNADPILYQKPMSKIKQIRLMMFYPSHRDPRTLYCGCLEVCIVSYFIISCFRKAQHSFL